MGSAHRIRPEFAAQPQTGRWLDAVCSVAGLEDASRIYQAGDGRLLDLLLVRCRALGVSLVEAWLPYGWGPGGLIAEGGLLLSDDVWAVFADLTSRRVSLMRLRPRPATGTTWDGAVPPAIICRPRWTCRDGRPLVLERWRTVRQEPDGKLRTVSAVTGASCRTYIAFVDGRPAVAWSCCSAGPARCAGAARWTRTPRLGRPTRTACFTARSSGMRVPRAAGPNMWATRRPGPAGPVQEPLRCRGGASRELSPGTNAVDGRDGCSTWRGGAGTEPLAGTALADAGSVGDRARLARPWL
jgi:hypothetical protein